MMMISRPMTKPPRNFSARSRSRAGIGHLERKINRSRRMSDCADRNVIDACRRDLANVLQSDAAARFEFHFFVFSKRDRLSNFRRRHVVEEDHVDFVDFQKPAYLLKRVGFDFDSEFRLRFSKVPNGFGELVESSNRREVIVLNQRHIKKTE